VRARPAHHLAALLFLAAWLITPSPADAQIAPSCPPEAQRLTGHWTTTETVDGENSSLWRGTLRLVQRGERIVGRWEPAGGQPERLVAGSFAGGVLRVAQRGTPDLAPAGVAASPSRSWLATLSSDGMILSGRWTEPATGAPTRTGELFVAGEATCQVDEGAPADLAPGGAGGPAPGRPGPGGACPAWDISGAWTTVGATTPGGPARLWLLQDGEEVLGWYETGPTGAAPVADAAGVPGALERAAGSVATAPTWTVDGQVRGTVLRLTLYAGDSLTLTRTFVLGDGGSSLSGPWPAGFGPPEAEVLTGQARCVPPR
jgi:hypothetical protein